MCHLWQRRKGRPLNHPPIEQVPQQMLQSPTGCRLLWPAKSRPLQETTKLPPTEWGTKATHPRKVFTCQVKLAKAQMVHPPAFKAKTSDDDICRTTFIAVILPLNGYHLPNQLACHQENCGRGRSTVEWARDRTDSCIFWEIVANSMLSCCGRHPVSFLAKQIYDTGPSLHPEPTTM